MVTAAVVCARVASAANSLGIFRGKQMNWRSVCSIYHPSAGRGLGHRRCLVKREQLSEVRLGWEERIGVSVGSRNNLSSSLVAEGAEPIAIAHSLTSIMMHSIISNRSPGNVKQYNHGLGD